MRAFEQAWTILKQRKPHITWLDPEKRSGWIDGRINIRADLWAGNNPGGYTESISDTYYDNAGLPRPEPQPPVQVDEEREKFMATMFDEQGNLKV